MTAHDVPLGPAPAGHKGPSASWREEDGRQNAVVGMIGRVYDLIVVEQPEKLASIAEATLEDALFESGRPVMMVPKTLPADMGNVVAVAWNGSTETALTVALGETVTGSSAMTSETLVSFEDRPMRAIFRA